MKELEVLLNQRWVLKSENKELYYQLRDAIGDIRKYASDKLGCQVTENALMVKMEKIPVIPENFMGILDFSSKEEYAFLCILLMFLEEKDTQEQFILSQLTDYGSPKDFLESDWFAMDEDRGIARRHRVYKRLLFAPGMYRRDGSEEDFEYLKYYGHRLTEDLEQNFDCHVHIHRGSAYVMLQDDCRMGNTFPGNNVLSDIILLCLAEIRKRIEQKEWNIQKNEIGIVDTVSFEQMIRSVRQKYGQGFSKNYREMPDSEFLSTVMAAMELWMFIKWDKASHQVEIYPAAGKLQGTYPKDFAGGRENE